jgi:hypothetical protein
MLYEEVSVKLDGSVANSWVIALQASSPGSDNIRDGMAKGNRVGNFQPQTPMVSP